MAFKPNYGQQRNERRRLKEARKQEKLKRRDEAVAVRRESDDPQPELGQEGDTAGTASGKASDND